jgi:nucleotide-binding universal stress UspA family protein
LIHLDQGERTALRLDLAVRLARAHGARLIGVFGQRAEPARVGVVATWPSPEYVEAAGVSRAAFERATVDLPNAQWHDVNRGGDAELLRRITELAHYADLVVLGQYDESAPSFVPPELNEEVILNCGRPVLVIPYAGHFEQLGQRPLITWNSSRESAHAISSSLPLIEGCEEATVMSVDPRLETAKLSCASLIDYLACHGIQAQSEVLVAEDVGVMDMILSRVSDLDADLLVMGANGSIGLPFVSRGSGTRHILRHMVVPVLMSD